MKLFRIVLSWAGIVGGILFALWEIIASVTGPTDPHEWGGWIGAFLFGLGLFLSGGLMLKRKAAGRYLFSACLMFVIFVCVAVLKFFSEPLVLGPPFQSVSGSTDISWSERGRIFLASVPDNFMPLLSIVLVLAGCLCLLCLVYSRRFRETFEKTEPPV